MFKRLIISVVAVLFFMCGTVMAGNKIENLLTTKEKHIVNISMFTANGDLVSLEKSIKDGLYNGLTVNEVKEIMIQLYAYCGFPRTLNALSTLMGITKNGIFTMGVEGSPLPANADKNKIGTKKQKKLVGKTDKKEEIFEFAPAIDTYLKEHLFADIFSRGVLSDSEREIVTIAALSSIEGVEPQLNAHIKIGKNTGLSDKQISEILMMTSKLQTEVFKIGEPNPYSKYFTGQSYLNILTKEEVVTANVTFEPKCRNDWHIHHKGGQILLVTGGRGYYQEFGKPAQELRKGDVVNIPAETKHWHGAAKDSWFSHIAIEVPSEGGSTEWLEEVDDEEYDNLP